MTLTTHHIRLDKWIVCSKVAFLSLSGHWRSEAELGSLLHWRLDSQSIEHGEFKQLGSRLEELAAVGLWNILVVVDEADLACMKILQHHADQFTFRLVEWHRSPLAVVLGMNSPDNSLLAALQNQGTSDPPDIEIVSPITDLEGYLAALDAWESECRENDWDSFADRLPSFAQSSIPWAKMLSHSTLKDASPLAANDNWVELMRLAAATANEEGKPISLEDPRNTPAQWTLILSPINGGPETLAVFRVNEAAIPAFEGCQIRLRSRGDIINLGKIDDEGQAELVLPSPIEMQGLAISWTESE